MNRKLSYTALAATMALTFTGCIGDSDSGSSGDGTSSATDASSASDASSTSGASSTTTGSSTTDPSSAATGSSTSAAVDGPYSTVFTSVEHIIAIDDAAGIVTVVNHSAYCEAEVLVSQVDTMEYSYDISSGKLTIEEDVYSCTNEQWTGSSTGLVGSWSDLVEVANPNAMADCDSSDMPWTITNSTAVVTSSSITRSATIPDFCASDMFTQEAEAGFVAVDCNTMTMVNPMGGTAIMIEIEEFDLTNENIVLSFSSAGTEPCSASMSDPTSDAECAAGHDDAMTTCLYQAMGIDPNAM